MKIRADISVYQPSSIEYMKAMKSKYNVDFVSVQLSYGANPTYDNRSSGYQVANAYKVFGEVGAYHFYLGSPVVEAKHFLSRVKAHGLDKTTELMLDVEGNLSGNLTAQINTFLDILYEAGYHNLAVYYNENFGKGMNHKLFHHKPKIWVAKYSTYKPNCYFDIWQFTQSARVGTSDLDLSYDYSKDFKVNPTYVKSGKLFKTKPKVMNVYKDEHLKQLRRSKYGRGSKVYGKVIKVGKVTRIKTAEGYISGNTDYVTKVM
ncbi:glycoside hydrolase family 25 protein [Apilactobacillus sp. TMW 2.2459]|uniref:glycoside hydrolase family 25 protein n=1 Tax=Apilactobacillus xinyiensis TaxID=2841032 RepID=UPI00200F86CE|nr:glycoside hydrolase family 25 protein [Apilactobacillus xinyiensis]MCL0312772.1 glycoside hydrolase family 25 protein [Apilactobacillus xinyiensis]